MVRKYENLCELAKTPNLANAYDLEGVLKL